MLQCSFDKRALKPNHLVRVLFITLQAFFSPMVTFTFDQGKSPKFSPSILRRVNPSIGPLAEYTYNVEKYIFFYYKKKCETFFKLMLSFIKLLAIMTMPIHNPNCTFGGLSKN